MKGQFFAFALGGAAAAASCALAQQSDCSCYDTVLSSLLATECGQQILASHCNNGGHPTATTTSKPAPPAAGATTPAPPMETNGDPFVGSYYPNWMVYRKHYMGLDKIGVTGQPVDPESASAQYVVFPSTISSLMPKLNALYYAFLKLDDSCYIVDADPDASWYGAGSEPVWIQVPSGACKGSMNDMLSLKSQYPHLKTLISVGGWTFSENFSRCAKSEDMVKRMYDSFVHYTRDNFGKEGSSWDGIDIDWEHPAAAGLTSNFDALADWPNYAKLVQYFKSRAASEGRTKFIITAAVGAGDTIDAFVKDQKVAKDFCDSVHHINMMTYDFHGKWEGVTGHNAPFCQIDSGADSRPAVKPLPWAVKDRVEAVVNVCGPAKVALGLPNYSPAWTDIPATNDGLYQTSTNTAAWSTWSTVSDDDKTLTPQGILHFWDLVDSLSKDSSIQVHSKVCPTANGVDVPVKWVYSANRKIFASFEDAETVTKKAAWAKAKGLAGVFFWDASQDTKGVLLDAARAGLEFTKVYPASGTKTCHDAEKPDFSTLPDGSANPNAGCHITARQIEANLQNSGCSAYKPLADAACPNGKSIAVGATRAGMPNACVTPCSNTWGAGDVALWLGDTIYYICDGEDVNSQAPSPPSGGNNSSGSSATCFAYNGWNRPTAVCQLCADVQDNQCKTSNHTRCYATMADCNVGDP